MVVTKSREGVALLYCISFILLFPISTFSQDHTDWSYNLGLYEVNVRQYTEDGTFAAFETHLDRLKEMGVGILWFMPINPIGVKNRLGSLGSYYSVKDYMDVNPEFGNLDDFKSLVELAHSMGFSVIIDWVANHTAWDNDLTISHPEWYTKDGNGDFTPPAGTDWSDVIDLDYSNQGLREYMTDAMKFWITETDIDGFRCDAATMVPLDFWETAITELKGVKPEILMLAEADGIEYQEAGFDMTFAWELYGFGDGVLPKIVDGSFNANFLASFLRGEFTDYDSNHYRLYFTSNHDENSWNGTVFERFGDAAENFAALTLTMNSMPLIYGGQEAGLNKRLQFFDKDQIIWNAHPFANVYSTLLHLKRENKALWNGNLGGDAVRVLTNNNPNVFSFIREKENNKIFAVFNLTDTIQNVVPTGTLFLGEYVNVFTSDAITFTENSQIELQPWGYKIFKDTLSTTMIFENDEFSTEYILEQNYPNPFNPSTKINFTIPSVGRSGTSPYNTKLIVCDILGCEVKTLINKSMRPGNYEIEFDGTDLPSGIYFYRLSSGGFAQTKKMLLLK